MKQLLDATLEVLLQVEQLVKACNKHNYNQPSTHSSSGIGRHVRHILDHFIAVEKGLTEGKIDYNLKTRDSIVESEPTMALQSVEHFKRWLSGLLEFKDQPVAVESEISVSGMVSVEVQSMLSREFCYLINHTVHHVAYATLLGKQNGIRFSEDLGMAPNTASFLRTQAVNG